MTEVKTENDPRTVVETMGSHYRRQATPEVWAEVDELRDRVAKLEGANRGSICRAKQPT